MKLKYHAVMIDCETLGVGPRPVVCTVGLAVINYDTMTCSARGLYELNWAEQIDRRRSVEAETMAWWAKQSPKALAKMRESEDCPIAVVNQLSHLAKAVGNLDVWLNGPAEDGTWLQTLFADFGIPCWNFRQQRCFRTLRALYLDRIEWPENTLAHDAQADALWQAEALCRILGVSGPVYVPRK